MPENQFQTQARAAVSAKPESAGTLALCKHCGAALDPDFPFCPNCGEKAEGEERTCEYCRTRTTKEFCPQCGRRVVPAPCPRCGTPSVNDACGNCGALLNPALEAALAQEAAQTAAQTAAQDAVVISADEAAKAAAVFKKLEQEESPEFKAFQKKLIERQILLEERDYFNKREKRIIKVFGNRPFTLELPDPQEEAFRMKAYAALEKTVIEREERAIEAELERMFPAVQAETVDAETAERNRAEMERTLSNMTGQITAEIDAIKREAERKRLEEIRRREEERRRKIELERRLEEERRRKMELERLMLEAERRKKRLAGVYHWESGCAKMKLAITNNNSTAQGTYVCSVCGQSITDYSVNITGDNISLRATLSRGSNCTYNWWPLVLHAFFGTVNESGTVITGYAEKNGGTYPMTFYKC